LKKKILLATVALLGLGAIAAAYMHPDWLSMLGFGEERAVRKRAEGYWNARIANDAKAMAPFIHPLQKAVQENTLLLTDSYEILGVKVNGNEAKVELKAKYRLKLPQTNKLEREITHEDTWVRYNEEWYHGLHPVGFGEVLQQGLGKWKPPTAPAPESGKTK
jgi:hypothetical protein